MTLSSPKVAAPAPLAPMPAIPTLEEGSGRLKHPRTAGAVQGNCHGWDETLMSLVDLGEKEGVEGEGHLLIKDGLELRQKELQNPQHGD